MKFLEKFAPAAYFLMRVVIGAAFAFHGAQKLFGVYSDRPVATMWTQMWVGGVIELVGGILVVLGLQTRFAAFICSGTMAVAYCQFHWKFQMGSAFFPAVNQGEMALLYCFIFLYIACRGALKWGIDKK